MKKEKGTFGWVFIFAGQKKSGYIASVIFAVIGAAFQILPFFVMAQVIGKLLAGNKDLAGYLIDCAVMAAFWLLRVLLHSLSTAQSHKATFAVLGNIRKQGLAKLAKMPLGDVQTKGSGELKNILVERVDSIEPTLAHAIPEMSSNAAVALATLIYLFVIDWRMALASLITFPLGMVFFMLMMAGYEKNYARTVAATNTLNDTAVEYIGGIEVVKTFNQGERSYKKYADAVAENETAKATWFKQTNGYYVMGLSILTATLVGVLPLGSWLFINGRVEAGTLITCIILALGLVKPLIQALQYTDSLAMVDSTVKEVGNLLDEPELVRPTERAVLADADVSFDHVTFRYKETEVLHGISFDCAKNGMTAIVGPSGSGKSTIARLIASFWEAESGGVRIGGVDVRNIPLSQIMELVSYVSQDNFLFHLSIRENIRIGKPEATDAEIEAAAKKASCHDFIAALPEGYDTLAGDAGSHLSGGERQRIAIARAILKNSPIVVLDEATAFTDPENEAVIQASIAGLVAGKTLIVIAHRLSTITKADKILVVDKGNVVAEGTHEELLETSNLYKELWRAHMQGKDTAEEVV